MRRKKDYSVLAVTVILLLGFLLGFFFNQMRLCGLPFNTDGLSAKQMRALNQANRLIKNNAISEHDDGHTLDYALKGIAASLDDPYACYYSPEETEQYNDLVSGSFDTCLGILAQMIDGDLTVCQVYDGLAAAEAGIKPGDVITAADGASLKGKTLDECTAALAGEEGTAVEMTVLRGSKELSFMVTRRSGVRNMAEYRMLPDTSVLYIRLISFHGNAAEKFKEALAFGAKNGYTGMVIDLRENGGGELSIFSEIADILLPEGETFYAMMRDGTKISSCTSDAAYNDKKICVLINGNSASASEALAGSLRCMGGAVLVGENSFGKGIMQNMYSLPNGGTFKLTVAKYYLPDGTCIHEKGLQPDIEVKLPDKLNERYWLRTDENDLQLQTAISQLTK